MILTTKQEQGLKIAVERYKNGEPYTCIAGYAGSGKSTLIKFIIAALNVDPYQVAYVAYTGKAANVLQTKGCPNAMTAHKLLYKATPMPDGSFIFEEKDLKHSDYKVIVVDEVSMLPIDMWELLISHHIYVIAAGDPGQLPPVDKDSNNHVLDKPHIFLDEIMRQAQDSEIIRLSMWVREGKPIKNFQCQGNQVRFLNPQELVTGLYLWPDQIICATNKKRTEINNIVRDLKGFSPRPQIGDKIVSLHNHWSYESKSGEWALTNGLMGEIKKLQVQEMWLPYYIERKPMLYMFTDIQLEDGDNFTSLPIDYQGIISEVATLNPQQLYQLGKNKKFKRLVPLNFTYGYAITAWKSQGSEWEKVLMFEEDYPRAKGDHIKALYTEITRAQDKLVVVCQ